MNLKKIKCDYVHWLKSEIAVTEFKDYYEITLPFLDHDNDYFQIYIKQGTDGRITITDDGYTDGNEIQITANESNYISKINTLLHAMILIDKLRSGITEYKVEFKDVTDK